MRVVGNRGHTYPCNPITTGLSKGSESSWSKHRLLVNQQRPTMQSPCGGNRPCSYMRWWSSGFRTIHWPFLRILCGLDCRTWPSRLGLLLLFQRPEPWLLWLPHWLGCIQAQFRSWDAGGLLMLHGVFGMRAKDEPI